MFDQILFMIKSLYISVLVVVLLTIIAFCFLMFCQYKLSKNDKYISIMGVFIDVDKKDQLKLALIGLKLFFIISMLVQINKLELIHYVALIEIIVFNFALNLPNLFALKSIVFDIAILASSFILNILCSYENALGSKIGLIIVVSCACIFVAIFEYYRFIDEVNHFVKSKKEVISYEEAN